MVFKEIICEKGKLLSPVFDQLFDLALKNQVHEGDLLLVNENGFYNPDALNWNSLDRTYLPYSIGPNNEGLSEYDHYKFIDTYRKTYECTISHKEYLNEIKWAPEKQKEIDELIFIEELSIQLEMLVYLKIWESDSFIKRFYQLARLSNGDVYDWHFKIAESNRDKNSTGTRQEILRLKVRNKFEKTLPILYSYIKKSFNTQVRNSIAHSKYSFLSRYIHLNNFIKGDTSSALKSLKFDDWIEMFHDTLILYNEYTRLLEKINSHYAEIAKKNNNLVEIKVNMKTPKNRIEYKYMQYRQERNDFKLMRD